MDFAVKDFQKEVIEKSFDVPVLVDFWAEWCGPCKVLSPVLERLAEQAAGNWVLAKVDTDKNQDLAAQFGIRGIPNCKLFSNGKVINEFTGALPEQSLKEWLKKSVPGKFADSIEKAKNLLRDGNLPAAKVILEEIHNGDLNNPGVNILLAKVLLFENPKEAIRLTEYTDAAGELPELSDSIKTLADLLSSNRFENIKPTDAKAEYLNAIAKLRNKNFNDALELFINVIRSDRELDDDGARKACIAIFKYLGEEHEITQKHRRDFGSALYV